MRGDFPISKSRDRRSQSAEGSLGDFHSAGSTPPLVFSIEPALRILRIVQRERVFSELERVLSVEHHCQFFGASRVLACHDRARMRAVRNSARMQCDRATLDAPARPKISAHIKQHLVGFNVIMHPRNSYSLGMGVEHARSKGAD